MKSMRADTLAILASRIHREAPNRIGAFFFIAGILTTGCAPRQRAADATAPMAPTAKQEAVKQKAESDAPAVEAAIQSDYPK